MPKEYLQMSKNNSSEQPNKKISPDILKIVFAERTPFQISEICIKNGVEEEEKIEEIAYQIGRVLLGKLPPNELREIFEKELTLDSLIAKKISEEINLNILSPVKDSLAKVYGKEITPPAKPTKITPPPEATTPPEEKPLTPPAKDVYRETIE